MAVQSSELSIKRIITQSYILSDLILKTMLIFIAGRDF